MKRLIFSFLPVILFINAAAQNPVLKLTENDLLKFSSGSVIAVPNVNTLYEGVRGTPYLNEKWGKSEIYFKNGTEIENVKIRYNIYKDELEFMNTTSGQTFIIDRQKVEGFNISESGNSLLFRNFSLKSEKKEEVSFVRVLYDGKTKLLLKYKKEFRPADFTGGYAAGKRYDEYIDGHDYYIVQETGNIEKVRLNKKSILSALENKEAELKKFASENDITFADEEDIIRLLTFYDNLK